MNLGIGSKLFLASVGVIVVVEVTAAIVLRAEVRETLEERAEAQLTVLAETARIGLETVPDLPRHGQVLASRIGAATRTEIEVFDSTGEILADSSPGVSGDLLTLPEVRAALAPGGGHGVARRGGRILIARAFRYGDGLGVVRVSAATTELTEAYRRLWFLLTLGAAIGLLVAIGMTLTATTLVRRSLRRLAGSAAEVATGGPQRIAVDGGGEIGRVGNFINRMADDARRTVSALESERSLLGSVLDGMTQGVIGIDGDRRMSLVNPAARTILDLPGVPIGEPFLDHVRIPAAVALVERALAGGGTATAEFATPGGLRVLARVTLQRSGTGCILVLDDVTAIRRLETIRRDFVANVSHELRTPVSVIRANAETLRAGAKDDPRFADRLIEGLHRNAERLSRIISDLLDLSRLEAGQVRIEPVPVAVAAAAEQARTAIEAQAAARPVTVAIDVGADVIVRADAKALDHVLVNPLDNAVKYTGAGGHVWVRTRRRGDVVRIEIADDGPGIAAHHRERIFERFYRVDAGRSREVGGTGLGLSIVRHLVESLGGQVGVDGNDPTGAVFWVELPAAR
ncbi:MAG TPA: ATP-binding protein [Kofleriaceae bacterium]|nr:ATP-binding protein [Kofleriaceae bacterium]